MANSSREPTAAAGTTLVTADVETVGESEGEIDRRVLGALGTMT